MLMLLLTLKILIPIILETVSSPLLVLGSLIPVLIPLVELESSTTLSWLESTGIALLEVIVVCLEALWILSGRVRSI